MGNGGSCAILLVACTVAVCAIHLPLETKQCTSTPRNNETCNMKKKHVRIRNSFVRSIRATCVCVSMCPGTFCVWMMFCKGPEGGRSGGRFPRRTLLPPLSSPIHSSRMIIRYTTEDEKVSCARYRYKYFFSDMVNSRGEHRS